MDLYGFIEVYRGFIMDNTLWSFNSLPWYRWPIEIDGLPFLIAW